MLLYLVIIRCLTNIKRTGWHYSVLLPLLELSLRPCGRLDSAGQQRCMELKLQAVLTVPFSWRSTKPLATLPLAGLTITLLMAGIEVETGQLFPVTWEFALLPPAPVTFILLILLWGRGARWKTEVFVFLPPATPLISINTSVCLPSMWTYLRTALAKAKAPWLICVFFYGELGTFFYSLC